MTTIPGQTEEDAYLVSSTVDEFAVADAEILDELDPEADEDDLETDQIVNKSIIDEIQAYCKTAIAEYNSFDVLQLPTNATEEQKLAVYDEMFRYKGLVHHLRQIQTIITNKVEEN